MGNTIFFYQKLHVIGIFLPRKNTFLYSSQIKYRDSN